MASFVNLIIGCFVLNDLSHAVFVNNVKMIDSKTTKKKKESGMKGKGKGLLSSQDR